MNPLPKRKPRRAEQLTGLPVSRIQSSSADDAVRRRTTVTRPEGVGVWSQLSGGIAAARKRGQR